jgi:hypothetical protein
MGTVGSMESSSGTLRDHPPAVSQASPVMIGVLPKVTGLEYVLWLPRKLDDRLPYVEITPTKRYDRKTALKFTLEPMIIGPTTHTEDESLHQVARFVYEHIIPIEDYYEWIIDERKVIELFRKQKYHR